MASSLTGAGGGGGGLDGHRVWPHWRQAVNYDTVVPGLPKDLRTAFVPIFTRLAAEGPTGICRRGARTRHRQPTDSRDGRGSELDHGGRVGRHGQAGGKELGVNRVAVLVYGGGAVLLAPWIVVLALSRKQEYRRLPPPAVVTGNVSIHSGRARPDGDHVSSAVSRRGRAGLVGGDVPLHSGWFNTITVKHAPLAIALAYDVFVKLPTIVPRPVAGNSHARDRGAHTQCPHGCRRRSSRRAVLLVPWFVAVLLLIQRTNELHDLRLPGPALTSLSWSAWQQPDGICIGARLT